MIDNMVQIESRYQYRAKTGIEWTKWFPVLCAKAEDDGKSLLKSLKEKIKCIDKVTRLKHEFRIVDI